MAIFPHLCQVLTDGNEYQLLEDKINIFPNPTTGEAFINFGDQLLTNVKIEVINLLGAKVVETLYTDAATNMIRVDLNDVVSGTYWVRITSGDNTIVKNISIVR
jgi:hypothetical protein